MELGKPQIQKMVGAGEYQAKEVLEYLCDLGEKCDETTCNCLKRLEVEPNYFVLKSLNEGGGGNYYGEEI